MPSGSNTLTSVRNTSLLVGSVNSTVSLIDAGKLTAIVSSFLSYGTPKSLVSCGFVPQLSFAKVDSNS